MGHRKQGRSKRPPQATIIAIFHVHDCILGPHGSWQRDIGAASEWLVPCNVQPESFYSVNNPPRSSLCPLLQRLNDSGEGSVQRFTYFMGLQDSLLLVSEHGARELLCAILVCF